MIFTQGIRFFDVINNSYKRSMTYTNSIEFKCILLFMYRVLYIN